MSRMLHAAAALAILIGIIATLYNLLGFQWGISASAIAGFIATGAFLVSWQLIFGDREEVA